MEIIVDTMVGGCYFVAMSDRRRLERLINLALVELVKADPTLKSEVRAYLSERHQDRTRSARAEVPRVQLPLRKNSHAELA